MTIENLISIVRLGRQLTPAQSSAVVAQLERIPAMERTLAAKDKDFTQLSIAYTAAVVEADKAEKGLKHLKNLVRKMLDAQMARDGAAYLKARERLKKLSQA